MQIIDILAKMGGIQSIARELDISETQATSGAEALLPAILGGFKKQAQSQSAGIEGVGNMLGKLGGGQLLDQVLAPQPTDVSSGNKVLEQIFGSKDVSRTVANNAAPRSGLDPSLLKKMLPMLTMLVSGYMAKSAGDSHLSKTGDSSKGLLRGLFGGKGTASPGIASMLDLNSDGNPLDDIISMAGKVIR